MGRKRSKRIKHTHTHGVLSCCCYYYYYGGGSSSSVSMVHCTQLWCFHVRWIHKWCIRDAPLTNCWSRAPKQRARRRWLTAAAAADCSRLFFYARASLLLAPGPRRAPPHAVFFIHFASIFILFFFFFARLRLPSPPLLLGGTTSRQNITRVLYQCYNIRPRASRQCNSNGIIYGRDRCPRAPKCTRRVVRTGHVHVVATARRRWQGGGRLELSSTRNVTRCKTCETKSFEFYRFAPTLWNYDRNGGWLAKASAVHR